MKMDLKDEVVKRIKENTCIWLDSFGICCNPFQDKPFQAECPKVQAKCGGYASSGADAAAKTRFELVRR